MAGTKKKKKPTANPARGFATTSIISKARVEPSDTASSDATDSGSKVATGATTPDHGLQLPESKAANKELKDLTPEELEAQLEQSELQQFVEQHAAKVRREASRTISRLETDRRLLRPQSEWLSVRAWTSDLEKGTVSSVLPGGASSEPSADADGIHNSTEDLLLQRLWTLRLILEGIRTPAIQVGEALARVLSSDYIDVESTSAWGLAEYFEQSGSNIDKYDRYEGNGNDRSSVSDMGVISADDMIAAAERVEAAKLAFSKPRQNKVQKPSRPAPEIKQDTNDLPELSVSDTDSDLDPEEMVSKYVEYKSRLSDRNLLDIARESRKGASQAIASDGQADGTRRLTQRMQDMEKDPLFDNGAADAAWRERSELALRKQAELRRLGVGNGAPGNAKPDRKVAGAATAVSDAAEARTRDILAEASDDDALFEGMFDAPVEGKDIPRRISVSSNQSDVVLRNFGKVSGVSPRRVLEEACKARDHGVKVDLRQVSETTYHCRHTVLISWSKSQEALDTEDVDGVEIFSTSQAAVVEATKLAAPSIEQSEAFICTVALFAVFSGSVKEEKASLRLPPAYRDLYSHLASARQDRQDAKDREIVKSLRKLIEDAQRQKADEEVVLTAAFRNRVNGTKNEGQSSHTALQHPSMSTLQSSLQELWSRKVAEPNYQRMLTVRQALPMHQFKQYALDVVRQHRITILCGETGCGKSTQMPAFILEDELSSGRDCRIYCTEPRRISAISLAQRVSEELGESKNVVGTTRSLVGYAIRLESQTAATTKLVYATVGIVLRMLESKDGIKDLTHLIIDEVHERSIDTDFLLIVLRTLLVKRPDLKVILMSATVDAEKFSTYLGNAPVITVPGRTYPVQALYLEDAIERIGYTNEHDGPRQDADDDDEVDMEPQKAVMDKDELAKYSKATVRTLTSFDEYRINYSLIMQLLQHVAKTAEMRNFSKAVLIFLPGIAEIRQLTDMITGHPVFAHGWLIYPLHSTFSSEDQQAAFSVPPRGMRKIVLATNIAETGITIPDVTCVIDTGKHKEMHFDERRQLSKLIQSFISRANAKQRRGRAGRVQEGICFHLFTRHRHDKMMAEQQTPEMLRLSLQDLVMRVKICKLGEIEATLMQALDPPSAKNIRRAIDALIEVGALTAGEELTALGNQLAKLPLDAQLGKLILMGSQFHCLDFALTIAAAASSKSPFLSPMNARRQADTVRLGFKRGDSDLMTTYNAYLTWRKICLAANQSEFDFCRKNFLSPANLSGIEELKAQLLSSLTETGLVSLAPSDRAALSRVRHTHRGAKTFVPVPPDLTANETNETLMSSVVAWSFYPKVLRREGKGWRSIANSQSLSLHPTSVNKLSPSPAFEKARYLSFYSIMQSSNKFTNAQEVTPVEPLALVLLAGDARFDFYAGVIIIDGNRLRFKVDTWREMVLLKRLRTGMREVLSKEWKKPGRRRTEAEVTVRKVVMDMFERFDEQRKAREGK